MSYKTIDTNIWMHRRFKKLTPNAKLLYMYLCFSYRTNVAGIVSAEMSDIIHDTKLPEPSIRVSFIELEEMDIEWDEERGSIWVKNYLEHQAYSPQYLKAVAKILDNIGNQEFVDRFIKYYKGKRNRKGMVLTIPYAYPTDTLSKTEDSSQETEDIKTEDTDPAEVLTLFNFWNEQGVIKHTKLTDKIRRAIKTALKDYTSEQLQEAIGNYGEIVNKPLYFFKYKWTLQDFLKRGIEKFIDGEVARNNYQKNAGNVSKVGGDTGEWKFR